MVTALGDTEALAELIGAGGVDTAQVCYSLLNPSADHPVPTGFPAQDFGRLLEWCRAQGVGVWPLAGKTLHMRRNHDRETL